MDENGQAAGAVLMNMETEEILVARAKTVIIATGGAGRLHYQGFPTSNHYGATADGLVLGYRAGAKLLYADTLQYHPTGAAYPRADLRRAGHRKGPLSGRKADQRGRRGCSCIRWKPGTLPLPPSSGNAPTAAKGVAHRRRARAFGWIRP